MKNYKVGDTIAVKAKVIRATNGSEMPYQVSYITGYDNDGLRRGNSFWVTDSEIVEPVKPALPKGVADELEDAKKSAYNFFGFLRDCNNKTYPETCHFMFYDTVSSDTQIKILSDAWYNGYTVEKPKLYNLVFGFDSYYKERVAFYKAGSHGVDIAIDNETNDDSLKHDDSYQFTQEEIDKYNKNFWINNIDLNDYKELVADD